MKTLNETSFLTAKEVADYLKVSEGHIRNLVYKGNIPFLKIEGVGLRFDKLEIENWALEGGSFENLD